MAHLLIIELPGGNDADILAAARARGDEYTFVSACLGHYHEQPAVAAQLESAWAQIEVAPFDDAELARQLVPVHARHPFDAVLCLVDIRIREAARLAATLGLRFLNPRSADLLRDKFAVRRRLAARGIPQPPFDLAASLGDIHAAVERLGLPAIVKPVDGYGSQQVIAFRHPDDLDPWLSPVDDGPPCRADYGLGVQASGRFLVERCLRGTIVGCDTLTDRGRHHLLGIHAKVFFEPPLFAIRGSRFTPRHPGVEAVERYLFSVLDAVDFDHGAAHTELMLTAEGPQVIEINPRLVGARIPRLVGLALGRSVYRDLIALHVGEGLPVGSPETGPVAVSRWITADCAGVLEDVWLPPLPIDPRIRSVDMVKQRGDVVRPPFENADRLGCVMACAPTAGEAEVVAEAYVSRCRVGIRDATLETPQEVRAC